MAARGRAGRPSSSSSADEILEQLGAGGGQETAQIPNLVTDPTWSLGLFPVDVDFGYKTFSLPAMPAIDWLSYLMGPNPNLYEVIGGIFYELEEYLFEDQNRPDDLTLQDLYETMLTTIGTVSGRPWWVAIRLIRVAADNWYILGPKLIMQGVDPTVLSLSGWLDCVTALVMEHMDPKDSQMFVLKLEAKPVDIFTGDDEEAVDPMEAMTTDRDAFLAFGD